MRKNRRRSAVVIVSLLGLYLLFISGPQFVSQAQGQPVTPTPTATARAGGGRQDEGVPSRIPAAPAPQAAANCPPTSSSSRFQVPECNDVTFVIDSDIGLDTGCTFSEGGPLIFNITINRYPGDIDKLLAAGLIQQNVLLRMPAYDVDYDSVSTQYAPERDNISLNGHIIGQLTGENNIWKLNTFSVNIKTLNFAKIENGVLVPGVNQIKIDIDTANVDETWCTAIDWATISANLPPPVLLVHGILSTADTWNGPWKPAAASSAQGWRDSIIQLGIPAEAITMGGAPGSPFALDSIQNNAAKIKSAINSMRTKYGVDKVNIVGHSKGGIDARHYIEDNDTVNALVQIGTPNLGSPLADIVQGAIIGAMIFSHNPLIGRGLLSLELSNPAGYQLTTVYMKTYTLFHGRNNDTRYISLGGDYDAEGFANILEYLLVGPDDSVVPLSSVFGLPYATHLVHQSAGADGSASHTGQTKGKAIFDKLRGFVTAPRRSEVGSPALALAETNAAPQPSDMEPLPTLAEVNAAPQPGDMKPLQTLFNTVTLGQTKSFPIVVDQASAVGFLLYHTGGNLDLSLVTPNGTVLTPSNAGQNSAVTFSRDDTATTNLEGYTIQNAAPGTYQVRVTGVAIADSSGAQSFIAAAMSTGSTIALQGSTEKPYYSAGESIIVRAQATSGSTKITGATSSAKILHPDNTSETLTLFDDGLATHGDQVASDGVYSNKLSAALAGVYKMVLSASKAANPAFQRETLIEAPVSASASRLGSVYSASARDTNGNGFFDELTIRVPLNVTLSGTYRVTGQLADKNGRIIDTATVKQSLISGAASADLVFDGARIYRNAVDGPYSLALVQFSEEGETSTQPLVELRNAYSTPAYTFNQFERDAIAIAGTGRDRGIDTNGDGLFEKVQVEIDIQAEAAGNYEWTGLLTDRNGREIGFAKNAGQLVAGKNVLTFVFNSSQIVRNGVAGPYALNSVLIFSNSASTVAFEVYQTHPYTINQFNRPAAVLLPLVRR